MKKKLYILFALFLIAFGINGVKAAMSCDEWCSNKYTVNTREYAKCKSVECHNSDPCNDYCSDKTGQDYSDCVEHCNNADSPTTICSNKCIGQGKKAGTNVYNTCVTGCLANNNSTTNSGESICSKNYTIGSQEYTKCLHDYNTPIEGRSCIKCNGTYIPYGLTVLSRNIISVIQLLVPIIIIITGMIELLKSVIASDEKKMEEAKPRLIRKLIAGIIIFLLFSIIKFGFRTILKSNSRGYLECVKYFISVEDIPTACPERPLNYKTNNSKSEESHNSESEESHGGGHSR